MRLASPGSLRADFLVVLALGVFVVGGPMVVVVVVVVVVVLEGSEGVAAKRILSLENLTLSTWGFKVDVVVDFWDVDVAAFITSPPLPPLLLPPLPPPVNGIAIEVFDPVAV